MLKFMIIPALVLATPLLAQDLAKDSYLGKTIDEVRATLTEKGYDVRKTETEDGLIEAYVVKDRQKHEIYVDTKSGTVVRIKKD